MSAGNFHTYGRIDLPPLVRYSWPTMKFSPGPAEGWRPIETAPKDGTEVLIWAGAAIICQWRDGRWDSDYYRLKDGEASHWMPLPKPPA